ncbi:MAG: hypothetical protein ABI835_21770, partial [Chloroflexota bacterium]
FGVETQPILYLPNTLWKDDLCIYEAIGDSYLGPKWLAPNFSGFLQRLLEDVKAYLQDDPNWKYMDHDLYKQKRV